MTYLIIAWVLGSLFVLIRLNKKKNFLLWLKYSLSHRYNVFFLKSVIKTMEDKNTLTLFLVEWVSTDYWFKNYWFGRQYKKIVLKELERLSK